MSLFFMKQFFALFFVISGKTANGLAKRSCLLCRKYLRLKFVQCIYRVLTGTLFAFLWFLTNV